MYPFMLVCYSSVSSYVFMQTRGERFYTLRMVNRNRSMKPLTMEAFTIDFQKTLPCLNTTTTDVYYRSQLSYFQKLSVVGFYTCDEFVAKKDANDIYSIFRHTVEIF